jgi:hypothetical protein
MPMKTIDMASWMAALDNKRKLHEVCLPGSHDAGVYTYESRGVNPGSTARCQYENIYHQAVAGSRVFDVRCFLRTTGFFSRKVGPVTMGHFFKEGKDGHLGAYGGTFLAALRNARWFLTKHPTEFLIFRISHTKCTGSVAMVLEDYQAYVAKEWGPTSAKFILTKDRGNLANLTVKRLRGKLLLVFDKEFNSPDFKPDHGYYPFYKYEKEPSCKTGLTFCGKYSGGLGKKFALTSEGKGNWSAEGAVELANAAYDLHVEKHTQDNHLLWIYWQETGGNIEKNTKAEDGMHDRLSRFLDDIEGKFKKSKVLPNVIGHDFVSEKTCRKIVQLNPGV